MKPKIQSVKGTRDFYPEQMALRNWLYQNMKAVSQKFGYQEYDGPFVETLELYAAKSGEELVKEQAFVFNDRNGDPITLRPELPPSLARMVAQRQSQLPRPIRWWSFGPFWRYERPQKGRSREFFQWNVDMLGFESPQGDAEVAAIGAEFFRAVGLNPDEVSIKVNNRRLVDAELKALGLDSDGVQRVFRLIDRREKMSPEAWAEYAAGLGLSDAQFEGVRSLLADRELWRKSDECVAFFEGVKALGVDAYVEYEPSVIRGLDYYTGMVFEARDRDGEFRAVFGGGRYDNLVGDVGGERIPGVGFAMGDVVVSLVLQKFGKTPELPSAPAQALVTVFDPASLLDSMALAAEVRRSGLAVEWYPEAARLQKQLKYADTLGIPFALIVGPDERREGKVAVKNLKTGIQTLVLRAEVGPALARILEADSER